MPSEIRSSTEFSEPAADVGYSLELKRSSRQEQTLKIVKERFLSPQANQSLKFQDKLKVENLIDQPCIDRHHGLRQNVDDGLLVQPNSSGNHQKQWVRKKAMKDDELVKHMSNLPGYLQRMDRGENVQEKALNVGVLNWEHLEKWKFNQKSIPARGIIKPSSTSSSSSLFRTVGSSTISNTVHNEARAHQSNQHSSLCSNINSSHKGGLSQGMKSSRGKVKCLQDFETTPKGTLNGQKKIPWTEKSHGRNYSEIVLEKAKRRDLDQENSSEMGTSSSNLGNYGISFNSKEKTSAWDGETKKGVEELQESKIKIKNLDQRIIAEMGTLPSNLRNNGVSLRSKEKLYAWNGETEKRLEEMQESDIGLAHQLCPGEREDIILLFPRDLPQNNFSELFQLSEPRISLDEDLSDANRKSFSYGFSPEVHSAELYSEIPHSCPLPCRVETNTEPDIKPHSLTEAVNMELTSDAYHSCPCSNEMPVMQSEGKHPEGNKLNIKPTNSPVIESFKRLDQETARLAATKGRSPSPNRRFSIGLGRMSKSFSFKEGSGVPQLRSTYVTVKSGPVTSEASGCLDNSSKDKANASNRARSSPLRRLLDPLLRPKGANTLYSAETVLPLKGHLNSLSIMPINASESVQNGKHKASSVHARLQFTIKNGLPLFKFEVDNNIKILAAPMTNLTTSGKDASGQNYAFYSVNEIKKKAGGWMNQGSRGKSCDYVYNIVGQMKISCPYSPNFSGQNSNNQSMVRESVLFGVELRQADQEMQKFMPNRELAAIVVKIREDLSHDGEQMNKDKESSEKGFTGSLPEYRCSHNLEENKHSCSTTVVLPDGVHGLPIKGAPSPLLDRWRSGGSCDCGGWDDGCKLRVLSNQDQSGKIKGESEACPIPDCFELFVQGAALENRPIFSLKPFKMGVYSVEFRASVSLLQAFFICVTVVSSDLSEVRKLSEARLFQEPAMNGDDRIKTSAMVQGELHPKFISYPPLSPVGRV